MKMKTFFFRNGECCWKCRCHTNADAVIIMHLKICSNLLRELRYSPDTGSLKAHDHRWGSEYRWNHKSRALLSCWAPVLGNYGLSLENEKNNITEYTFKTCKLYMWTSKRSNVALWTLKLISPLILLLPKSFKRLYFIFSMCVCQHSINVIKEKVLHVKLHLWPTLWHVWHCSLNNSPNLSLLHLTVTNPATRRSQRGICHITLPTTWIALHRILVRSLICNKYTVPPYLTVVKGSHHRKRSRCLVFITTYNPSLLISVKPWVKTLELDF